MDSIVRRPQEPYALPYGLATGLGRTCSKGIYQFGELPDLDASDGTIPVWDLNAPYVPPTQARIHDLVSTDAADAGVVLASGTFDDSVGMTITDNSADFVSAGVLQVNLSWTTRMSTYR